MVDAKRKLNIPMYDVRDVPEGAPADDEVIDVEVLNDRPTLAERLRARAEGGAASVAETLRNIRVNGAWDGFVTQPMDNRRDARGQDDPYLRARKEGRARRDERDRVRSARAADDRRVRSERVRLEREARRDPLAQLRLDTARAGEEYMLSLRQSGILSANATPAKQREQLSGLHQVYASMMVLQCVAPLKQGLSGTNVISALGMAASMWALSPEFRTQLGNFADKLGDAVHSKIRGREEAQAEQARSKLAKLASKGRGDQLGAKWRRRLERIEHAERGHRLPFTAQSAAMTEVALAEAAYADMRRPGANLDAIQDRYDTALGVLYGYAEADGLDRTDVSSAMRVIVGQRMDRDPDMASVFTELGHGAFTKSEPREVYIAGTTEKRVVWTGDFVDAAEGRVIAAGSFQLRPPMDIDEHRVQAGDTLAAEMCAAATVDQMDSVLSQYIVAASVQQYPEVVDRLEDATSRTRFGRVRAMFKSMSDDGLSADAQHFAYTAAYVDAVQRVQEEKPELATAWVAKYGENWQEKVAEDLARFKNMGAHAAREEHAPDAPFEHYSARSDKSSASPTAEDIVDAEVVEDGQDAPRSSEERPGERAAREPGTGGAAHRTAPIVLEQAVYEGDVETDGVDDAADAVIDLEAYPVEELGAASHREAIEAAARESASEEAEQDSRRRRNTVAKIRGARVNQHYNEVKTGRIVGLGSDDAAPLQDVDFQLG